MKKQEGIWMTKRCNINKIEEKETIVRECQVYCTKDNKENYIVPRIYIETIKIFPSNLNEVKTNLLEKTNSNQKLINTCLDTLNDINTNSLKFISNITGVGENNTIENEMLPVLKDKLLELKQINYYKLSTEHPELISNKRVLKK